MTKTTENDPEATKRRTVALPADLIEMLDKRAKAQDRSRAYVATQLLRETLSGERKAS